MKFLRSGIASLRPASWAKNLFVLAPLLFARGVFSPGMVMKALLAFASFCLISSAGYLLNDLKDRKADRLHPVKCQRPVANGELAPSGAAALLAASVFGSLWIGFSLARSFAIVIVLYGLVSLLYSLVLKRRVIVDVFSIAAGFVLRVVGGGIAIDVELSHWLLLCSTLLALFLGFSKRRHELVLLGDEASSHRSVLSDYSPLFLDMMIAIVTSCTLMSYALYTVSDQTVAKFQTQNLFFTLPFVCYGIFRYLYLVYHKSEGGDPTVDLVSDPPMVANLCLWALSAALILYWQ